MSKSIKVSEEIYQKLIEIHEGRDTFGQTVERLIKVKEGVEILIRVVEGNKAYAEYQAKQLKENTPAQ